MVLAWDQFAWTYLHTDLLELLGSMLVGCCLRVSSIPLWSDLPIVGIAEQDNNSVDESTRARLIKVEVPLEFSKIRRKNWGVVQNTKTGFEKGMLYRNTKKLNVQWAVAYQFHVIFIGNIDTYVSTNPLSVKSNNMKTRNRHFRVSDVTEEPGRNNYKNIWIVQGCHSEHVVHFRQMLLAL